MTWESLKSGLSFGSILEFIERDWPDHDWYVQRIANALERDKVKMCETHQVQGHTHFASILPHKFIMTKGKEGDRFVGFGKSSLEAIEGAYANLINVVPDMRRREYQENRRRRRKG